MPTTPWDEKLISAGMEVWHTRSSFFKDFIKTLVETQKKTTH